MKWDHVIRNGYIVTTDRIYQGHIYVKDGKIAAISDQPLPGEAVEETDAAGRYILPGLIDVHVHSRDPGSTHKEDFYHSTQAAAAGGITTIFEMPNTNPPLNNVANYHKQVSNLETKAHVDFGIWAICLGHLNMQDIAELHRAGVIGFKFFWGYAVHSKTYQLIYNYKPEMEDVIPPFTDGEVYEIFREVAKTGQILAIHAESSDLIHHLTKQVEASGRRDYEAFLEGRPNLAEVVTVQTGIAFAKATGARLHILHVSTGEAVDLIKQAQAEGYPITAETCPHYLFLSNEDYPKIGPAMKVYPTVKYRADQDRLWEGIREGVISVACSDHAPHTEEEKAGDLWSIPAGMCGVETLAPLLLNAVHEQKLTLSQVVALLSENPAKLFGIYPQKGSLQVGTDADITIVDMERPFTIKQEELHSKSKVTAFDRFSGMGSPVATIVRGRTVMRDGKIVAGPTGRLVTPADVV
ncbi:allantoinase AllB [Brevibacillus humidisoli]|uniref:allantoinase AllB n=1 Tax=Brevibacillus humidisoli TaxID=2895522 RepID=UPI001E5BFAC4|nr:allantoinase AllB [Brevibacillus humidisoli]UFJ41794.1 allantoinase AllB [Brevibacillus humidisoli]